MYFYMKDDYSGVESEHTEHYPIDQSNCLDIAEQFPSVREGETIETSVKAILGVTNSVQHTTTYTSDKSKVTWFTCRGTTLNYHCNDEDLDDGAAFMIGQIIDLWEQN